MRLAMCSAPVLALALLALAGCKRSDPAPPDPAATTAATLPPEDPKAVLAFVRDGRSVRTLGRAALEAAVTPETWTAYDPYYNRPKTFRALPLAATLVAGFGVPLAELEKLDFVLRARDGYTVPLPGTKLLEKGGYLAVADVDGSGWQPIGPQAVSPAPFYLVWREPSQRSLDSHPRPWQLASIEIAPFDVTFPLVVPSGLPADAPAMAGFRRFRASCISCHAMNRQGGRVGPELNVPQSIVEYRPRSQIRAYIKDPSTFRYGNMPAHPGLTEADLDELLAYFDAMKDRKHDSQGKASAH